MLLCTDTVTFRNMVALALDTNASLLIVNIADSNERYQVTSSASKGAQFQLTDCSGNKYSADAIDSNLIVRSLDMSKKSRPIANFRIELFYEPVQANVPAETEYMDSSDFTDEWEHVKSVLQSSKMLSWFTEADNNYGLNCKKRLSIINTAINDIDKQFETTY